MREARFRMGLVIDWLLQNDNNKRALDLAHEAAADFDAGRSREAFQKLRQMRPHGKKKPAGAIEQNTLVLLGGWQPCPHGSRGQPEMGKALRGGGSWIAGRLPRPVVGRLAGARSV